MKDEEFLQLSNYTKTNFGIDLSDKRTLVESRLYSYLSDRGHQSFPHFFGCLVNDHTGTEATALVNRLTTNYTFFMREPNHFRYFQDSILPYLTSAVKDRDLRIWSAGCSSGEEPYTLAMIMSDYFGKAGFYWDTKILATDISSQVLETALRATYNDVQIKDLPANWKLKYFEPGRKGKRRLVSDIRDAVIFRKFNLMEKIFPFKRKFHVIFCRNVMIYFDSETRRQLLQRFYESTEFGGYLIIGHSESIDRKETGYRYIMPSVYRKE